MKLRSLLVALGVWIGVLVFASSAWASEGTVELGNVVGGEDRCWAGSILMRDFNYQIIFSCRDLLYVVDETAFNLTLWAQERDTGDVFSLGDVGIGKRTFSTNKAFSRLFVTRETASGRRDPSGVVIMDGNMVPIAILQEDQPTPTATPVPVDVGNFGGQAEKSNTETETPASGALSVLRIVGVLIVVIILIVVVIALVSAMRRRPPADL